MANGQSNQPEKPNDSSFRNGCIIVLAIVGVAAFFLSYMLDIDLFSAVGVIYCGIVILAIIGMFISGLSSKSGAGADDPHQPPNFGGSQWDDFDGGGDGA